MDRHPRKSICRTALLLAAAAAACSGPSSAAVLPIPANIANGATVRLQCGNIYQGTLDLSGKSDVTVKTVGNCGKARISPGRAVTGWTRHAGNIYSAPIRFIPLQVAVGGAAVSAAHWPNRQWATSDADMPGKDLAGATQVILENQSVIRSLTLAGNSVSTGKPFYVEGKLWMLDSPGEWAVRHGRLYLWTPDGASPEGRTWAAPAGNGIDADRSRAIIIDGVAIFSARDGISAAGSTNLTVRNTDIDNSGRDGIWASGSHGLRVDGCRISNARRNGIDGWYAITGAVITDSTVSNTGMVGMPSPTDAAIMFGAGAGNRVDHVRVTGSAYHGINVMRNRRSLVRNSLVDAACARLTDCGAIYTSARDRQPLDLLIEGNTVTNTRGRQAVGIYLDDHANGVTVSRNIVTNNTRALVLHNGFDNVITNNLFASSTVVHLGLSQDNGRIHHVRISGNTFRSTNGEQTFNLESGANLKQFATYDYNRYVSTNFDVFGRTWDGRGAGVSTTYQGWKQLMGQDAHSVATDLAPGAAPARPHAEGSLTAP